MGDPRSVKRAVKNTAALYVRMIVLVLISFYTVRIVLDVLGADDYGIYNVVGGFVSIMTFVTGTLNLAAQRYFATSLAYGNWQQLSKLFSVNLVIAASFSLASIVLLETGGLWFVGTHMVIPAERIYAAKVVFELSALTFVVNLLVCPYLALLIADENLSIYAIVSVIEGICKLLVVYLLYHSDFDRLITYAALSAIVSVAVNGFYVVYVHRMYDKLKLMVPRRIEDYREMTAFMGWNLIGVLAILLKWQGLNVLTNMFFGVAVNAARGIAAQISHVMLSFSQNFMKAVDPQITKTYAVGDKDGLLNMVDTASKVSYFLLFLVSMPFMANAGYVLSIWLVEVPAYTVIFVTFMLIDVLITQITDSVGTVILATGNIKFSQLSMGIASVLLHLPIAYIALKLVENPVVPLLVCIVASVIISALRLVNLGRIYDFSISRFCRSVFLPIGMVTLIVVVLDVLFFSDADNLAELTFNVVFSSIITVSVVYAIGLNKIERSYVRTIICKKLTKVY